AAEGEEVGAGGAREEARRGADAAAVADAARRAEGREGDAGRVAGRRACARRSPPSLRSPRGQGEGEAGRPPRAARREERRRGEGLVRRKLSALALIAVSTAALAGDD